MSSLDLATELEARAAALRAEAALEADLRNAAEAYDANPTDDTRTAYKQAQHALHEARSARRSKTVQVGGDATIDSEEV